jgi:predicted Zn-dependent peptidase
MNDIQTHVFKNGLPAVYLHSPSSRAYTAALVVGAGTRFETEEQRGISRFYANLCFQGTASLPKKSDLWLAIDKLGLTVKPAVYPEYSLFYFSSSQDRFIPSIELMFDLLYQPALRKKGIEAEKKLSTTEINISNKNPQLISLNTLTSLMFNNTSLGYDALGTSQAIEKITKQSLQQFKEQFYVSQNSLLLILGPEKNFSFNSLEASAAKASKGPRATFAPFDFNKTQTVQEKVTQQGQASYITFGTLSFGRNSDKRIPQNLLLNLLSEGRTNTRLKSLRQKRLVSYIKPWIKTFSDCGLFLIQAACPSNQEAQVIEEVKKLVQSLGSDTITQDELNISKAYYENKLELGLSNSLESALFYSLSFFFNLNEQTPNDVMNNVKGISLKDLNELSKIIFRPDVLSWVNVGPGY